MILRNYSDIIYSKYFKKKYNDKPTKRYLQLLKKIENGERLLSQNSSKIKGFTGFFV